MLAACPVHLILLDLVILIIFGKELKWKDQNYADSKMILLFD
jgi:hypothetical protein